MNSQEYLDLIKSRFKQTKFIKENTSEMLVTYEEVFKWKWIATKLKIFSFVKSVKIIDLNIIRQYSAECLNRALKEKRGLPRGFQNGVVSYNILVCDHISDDAIKFVTTRPDKHYSAFEYPMIYDLTKNKLHYYHGEIIWGQMYDKFMSSYIVEHFEV